MSRMEQFYDIAQAYFRGTISDAEEVRLSEWLKENEANRTQFHQWEREWHQQARSQASAKTQAAWERLKAEAKIPQTPIVRPLNARRMWYYAAAMMLLLIGSAVLWLFRPTSQEPTEETTPFVMRTNAHERQTITLEDGTEIVMNAQSVLACADDFNKQERRVAFEGEALFRVAKDPERPFVLNAGEYEVTVLGTEFNLSAYPKDTYYTLSLISGSVQITYLSDTVYVQPNEQVRFNLATHAFNKQPYQANTAATWINNRLDGEMPLCDLVTRLERMYDVQIEISDADLSDEIVYISISSDESFDDVCDALETLLPIQIQQKENSYTISMI